jgi:hypothetical protein
MMKFYIPKEEIHLNGDQIQDGDLIAISTTIYGMEVAHVGIVIHINKVPHLMHASSLNKKVEISELSLSDILINNSTYSGIIISRLKNRAPASPCPPARRPGRVCHGQITIL